MQKKQDQLNEINETLSKFWNIECITPPLKDVFSVNNGLILEKIRKTFSKCNGVDRYEIGIPWNERKRLLQNNFEYTKKRLSNTEQQLEKRPEVKKLYCETLKKYKEKGYIKEIDSHAYDGKSWFLPHFPVIRMEKETSKVRIVFDASAQHKGISLNDTIDQGPNLHQDLFKVLLRFRKNKIAIACDIEEMYLQVQFSEEDRKFFRFLWRDSQSKTT